MIIGAAPSRYRISPRLFITRYNVLAPMYNAKRRDTVRLSIERRAFDEDRGTDEKEISVLSFFFFFKKFGENSG